MFLRIILTSGIIVVLCGVKIFLAQCFNLSQFIDGILGNLISALLVFIFVDLIVSWNISKYWKSLNIIQTKKLAESYALLMAIVLSSLGIQVGGDVTDLEVRKRIERQWSLLLRKHILPQLVWENIIKLEPPIQPCPLRVSKQMKAFFESDLTPKNYESIKPFPFKAVNSDWSFMKSTIDQLHEIFVDYQNPSSEKASVLTRFNDLSPDLKKTFKIIYDHYVKAESGKFFAIP
jgi:hypothetical protein